MSLLQAQIMRMIGSTQELELWLTSTQLLASGDRYKVLSWCDCGSPKTGNKTILVIRCFCQLPDIAHYQNILKIALETPKMSLLATDFTRTE